MQKCNLCCDRWESGHKPICVEACPMRALDAGPQEEMESKYHKTDDTATCNLRKM
jgi:anaerobic dimethyl sulfoxide reductase subunit B (iron-sulfur subunit)